MSNKQFLQVLCIGDNVSKNKIEQAKNNNIQGMNQEEFLNFLDTGEILYIKDS